VTQGLGFAYVGLNPDGLFDRVVLTDFQNEAFEYSSLEAAVPLPAAAWLMIGGLGAVGALGRYGRRRKAADAGA
jgi:hypothetical protein